MILTIIVLIVLVGGGYALFHKSSNKTSSSNTSNSSSKQTSTTPVNNAILTTKTDPSVGQYLADPSGKALYTYNADSSGVSNCSGSCLADWPAYAATASTANLPSGVSTITRSDNHQLQYTYNGAPLYYFVGDSLGKVTGNGEDNFKVAKPAPASSSQPASPAPSSTQSNTNSSSGSPY